MNTFLNVQSYYLFLIAQRENTKKGGYRADIHLFICFKVTLILPLPEALQW